MSQFAFTRALTPADDVANAVWTANAVTADGKFTAPLTFTVSIAPPIAAEGPPVWSGWPSAVAFSDLSPAGTVFASGSLTDSDGTAFTGTVTMTDANGNPVPVAFTP
jgi:hypothetical protein